MEMSSTLDLLFLVTSFVHNITVLYFSCSSIAANRCGGHCSDWSTAVWMHVYLAGVYGWFKSGG